MKSLPGLVQDVGHVLEVARGLLDADDVVVRAAQAPDSLRRDVDGGPDGHVVDDDRKVGELGGDARVPPEQALLLGTPVVGGDDEGGGGAEALRLRGQLERLVHERTPRRREERARARRSPRLRRA